VRLSLHASTLLRGGASEAGNSIAPYAENRSCLHLRPHFHKGAANTTAPRRIASGASYQCEPEAAEDKTWTAVFSEGVRRSDGIACS